MAPRSAQNLGVTPAFLRILLQNSHSSVESLNMARKALVEIEGGLYHVITRGNDRHDIFRSHEDLALSIRTTSKKAKGSFIFLSPSFT